MRILSDNFYKKMFTLAAPWNLCIGFTGLVFTRFSIELFFGPGAVTGDFIAAMSFRLFMVAIMAFGVGYFMVSRDLYLNRGIVWLGLSCKMILFVLFSYFFIIGKATVLAELAVTGDFAWSLLFFLFLHQTRDRVKRGTIIG